MSLQHRREAYQHHRYIGKITLLAAYANIIGGIFLLFWRDLNYNDGAIYSWPSVIYALVFLVWCLGTAILYRKLKRGYADVNQKKDK